MDEIFSFNSVETLQGVNAAAAFSSNASAVFREDFDTAPISLDENTSYMPWGSDDQMPFDIMELIERDETLSTCQLFNAEVCYGSGLVYNTDQASPVTRDEVQEFTLNNDLASYFLGVCQDFKYFGFAVSVIILNADCTKVLRIRRKEACYCRFAPADISGRSPYVLYGNWRKSSTDKYEKIPLLDPANIWADLQWQVQNQHQRIFAVVTKVPTPDHTYYPIPYYAALFKGKWFNIKQLIGIAKEAKLKNSAPIKYHIEVSNRYWESIFKSEGITDRSKQQERIVTEKKRILDFLTGAENSGKVWFSMFYITPDGKETHDVVINKVDMQKEGGDWESDIQEAINMICFTMRVHSNLVGSVPGKAQTNNSGSDKRELYTIAHALQKPYHDLLLKVHNIIIKYNEWHGVFAECPFVQLTTLDQHTDAKTVTIK